jgi:hypothetical protein
MISKLLATFIHSPDVNEVGQTFQSVGGLELLFACCEEILRVVGIIVNARRVSVVGQFDKDFEIRTLIGGNTQLQNRERVATG